MFAKNLAYTQRTFANRQLTFLAELHSTLIMKIRIFQNYNGITFTD